MRSASSHGQQRSREHETSDKRYKVNTHERSQYGHLGDPYPHYGAEPHYGGGSYGRQGYGYQAKGHGGYGGGYGSHGGVGYPYGGGSSLYSYGYSDNSYEPFYGSFNHAYTSNFGVFAPDYYGSNFDLRTISGPGKDLLHRFRYKEVIE